MKALLCSSRRVCQFAISLLIFAVMCCLYLWISTPNEPHHQSAEIGDSENLQHQEEPRRDGEHRIYDNSIRIEVPALMILGPPKSSTSTLANEFQKYHDVWRYTGKMDGIQMGESQFWGTHRLGNNKCSSNYTESEWTRWTDDYVNDRTSLSAIMDSIHPFQQQCTVKGFHEEFQSMWALG